MAKIEQTAGRNALGEFAPQFAHFIDYFCPLIDSTQLFMSIAIVIGPTPPGTGVIADV